VYSCGEAEVEKTSDSFAQGLDALYEGLSLHHLIKNDFPTNKCPLIMVQYRTYRQGSGSVSISYGSKALKTNADPDTGWENICIRI